MTGPAQAQATRTNYRPYRQSFSLSTFRNKAHWHYLLTESQKTEYGSEFWIVEHKSKAELFYCRIPQEGFGSGLIVSEVSEGITFDALKALFSFCKQKAEEREKPYLRLNLHNHSTAGRIAVSMGAKPGTPYAWQIRIPNPIRLLTTLSPLLEGRIQASSFKHFSGTFRLNFFKSAIDLHWKDGRLGNVHAADGDCQHSFTISTQMFPALCLGHRTWQELRHIHPDIFPGSDGSAAFIETLFPTSKSWIYQQY